MAEFNEVSRLLGRIESTQEATNERLDRISDKVETLTENHNQRVLATTQVANKVDLMDLKINSEVMPTVEEVKRLKQRSIGILTVVGVGSTGAAFFVNKMLKHFFS